MTSTTNTFTGSVINTILQSATVPGGEGAPGGDNSIPPRPFTNDYGLPLKPPFVPNDPLTQNIIWQSSNPSYPSAFNGISINQLKTLVSNGIIPGTLLIEMRYNVKSGIQERSNFSRPTLTLYTWDTTGNPNNQGTANNPTTTLSVAALGSSGSIQGNITYCVPSGCPSSPFGNITSYSSGGIFVNPVPWNSNAGAKTNYQARMLTLEIEFRITLTVTCNGSNLTKDMGFCPAFCLQNLTPCYEPYLNYCFSGNPPNIGTDTGCQVYFEGFISQYNSNGPLDAALTNYCTNKYDGFEDLVRANNQVDLDLCGCHMQPEQYANLAAEFYKNFNIQSTLGINPRCLVPFCAASSFRTASIGNKCNVPPCLNITQFNANGTFNNNNVTISQNNDCPNIVSRTGDGGGGGGGNGDGDGGNETNQSFWSKYKVWFIVGIAAVVVIIIIIIIVIVTSSGGGDKGDKGDKNKIQEQLLLSEYNI